MKVSLFILVIALLASCGSATTKTGSLGTTNASEVSAPAADNSKGTEIAVTLTGGANAGTYKASSNESTCSMGLTGEKSFGNQYYVTGKGEKELSSVQVVADNYDEAKKGTRNFNMQFSFGDLPGGASYSLNPNSNLGTGTLTMTESGSAKSATIEGKTKEGVCIKAVITCKTVQKMVDGQLKEE